MEIKRNLTQDIVSHFHKNEIILLTTPRQVGKTTMLRVYVAWKGWSVYYWRTTDKAKVDFIIDKKQQVLPVEVKYGPE